MWGNQVSKVIINASIKHPITKLYRYDDYDHYDYITSRPVPAKIKILLYCYYYYCGVVTLLYHYCYCYIGWMRFDWEWRRKTWRSSGRTGTRTRTRSRIFVQIKNLPRKAQARPSSKFGRDKRAREIAAEE